MPSGALACLGVVLGAYLAVLVLSYYWYVTEVLPRLHKALQDLFGESYHRRGCPARVWRLIDACGPEARQRRRDIRARAAALKQLRSETTEADTAKAASCQALAPAQEATQRTPQNGSHEDDGGAAGSDDSHSGDATESADRRPCGTSGVPVPSNANV